MRRWQYGTALREIADTAAELMGVGCVPTPAQRARLLAAFDVAWIEASKARDTWKKDALERISETMRLVIGDDRRLWGLPGFRPRAWSLRLHGQAVRELARTR
jgi:hypothetical protein